MFDSLRQLLSETATGDEHTARFQPDDHRLAAAALMVHAAAIDGDMSEIEREKVRSIVKRVFELDRPAADELVDEATEAEHEAIDLYHFTSMINRALNEDGRRRIVEMMWEIAYADGHVGEFETNLLWRAADLLGISGRERIEIGQRVAEQRRATGSS
ncbi:MAG: TerB family tellurite resistance protein [Hyphomicrobiales bacterium]|nr:TerB family tellurite resistance protein [Hyphomicrobiales bacterium]